MSGQAGGIVGIAADAPDEVMLIGELIAAAKAFTGAGNELIRSNLATAEVVDADCIGRARLRNAWGTADIARTSASCALSEASAAMSTGLFPIVGGASGVRVVAAAEAHA
jgi:hypothetical protein